MAKYHVFAGLGFILVFGGFIATFSPGTQTVGGKTVFYLAYLGLGLAVMFTGIAFSIAAIWLWWGGKEVWKAVAYTEQIQGFQVKKKVKFQLKDTRVEIPEIGLTLTKDNYLDSEVIRQGDKRLSSGDVGNLILLGVFALPFIVGSQGYLLIQYRDKLGNRSRMVFDVVKAGDMFEAADRLNSELRKRLI